MAMLTIELVSLSGTLYIFKVPAILKARDVSTFSHHQMILAEALDMLPDFIAIKPLKNILLSGIKTNTQI